MSKVFQYSRKVIFLIIILFTLDISAKTCSEVLNFLLNMEKIKSLKSTNLSDPLEVRKKLNKLITKSFKSRAKELGIVGRRKIKRLSIADKEKFLLLLGVTFAKDSKGNYSRKTIERVKDNSKILLIKKLKQQSIGLENIKEIVFEYPKNERDKIEKIIDKHKEKLANQGPGLGYQQLLLKLSQDNGNRVYNSTIWNFMAHDWSSPVESAVKYYMNKALQNSKLGLSVKSRINAIEDTVTKEIQKTIDRLPGDTLQQRNVKKYLKMYLSLATVCKAVNMAELLNGVAKDMNSIVKDIEDPIEFKKALEHLKEVSLSKVQDSVVSFLPKRNGFKSGMKDVVNIIEDTYTGIKNGLTSFECLGEDKETYDEHMNPLEKVKKKANEVANIFGGKHLHDAFKINNYKFSKSDCKEMYIEQSKKVVSILVQLMFVEKMNYKSLVKNESTE